MRKTRDLFKKIRDTKKNYHAKMGTIKDRNGACGIEGDNGSTISGITSYVNVTLGHESAAAPTAYFHV